MFKLRYIFHIIEYKSHLQPPLMRQSLGVRAKQDYNIGLITFVVVVEMLRAFVDSSPSQLLAKEAS